jgi:hypothetical protein
VRVREVQDHRPLVAIYAEVVRGDAVVERRRPGPGVVAARAFDLDDVGAEVGEEHRRVRARKDPGEVRDEEPVEGSGCGLRHGRGSLRLSRYADSRPFWSSAWQAEPDSVKRGLDTVS